MIKDITDFLSKGEDNAVTGKELAALLGVDIRQITKTIEMARRAGAPICANSRGKYIGYYLAANDEELEAYCNRIHNRAAELFKTRAALLNILKQRRDQLTIEESAKE